MTNHLYDALFAPHRDNDAVFLRTGAGDAISYRAFVARAAQIAAVLTGAGVGAGDRVVVQAPKHPDMLALYAATLQCGAVFLPLNTAYTEAELSYFISDAAPGLVVCDAAAENRLAPIAAAAGAALLTLERGGAGSLQTRADAADAGVATVARAPDDLAALLYTSGTTGRSKGAMLTHDNLLSNARTLVELWRIARADRLIHALPIFHTHGLFVAINTALLAGAEMLFLETFDRDRILEALPAHTLMMGVPTFYTRLLADARLDADRCANMRLFVSGSAPLLAETHDAFAARTGHRILERYGMTETSMITSNPYDGARRAGTVGQPLDGVEVRLTDADGNPVPEGEVGMIEVRGPNVFKGYWNMPEKTAAELRSDGFFITGDLGQHSADGYLSIVGRARDLIITGGYNVYPGEIETVLNALPGIAESAVFGVPDADFGEAIVAAVVPADRTAPPEETLRDAVGAALARFKHPRHYWMLEALPRNAMGKVQKAQLREDWTARSATGTA
ncbi:AMP-binding protein [Rhodobacteraceae bacterium 2CG4]|uniref:AMP-binding protein n=1 Tax=Halovulum marinum TaxID=2662447 RepID=A0A6L5YY31_9RHOB|nr:AMP-binding protein [Halovulum marinum]MSU89108.1 AMP-binding protein [Halovulum marinum]